MGSPSGVCSIPALSAFVQKKDVDNRTPLRIYYMIADCSLRRADIYREEKNIIDLCIMLMQFSSLMSETIPYHRDYLVSLKSERFSFEEKLSNALTELEMLKPTVESLIEEQNRKRLKKVAESDQVQYPSNLGSTPVEMPRAVLCVKETLRRHPMLGHKLPNNSGFSAVEMPTPVEIPRAVLCVKETLRRHPMLGRKLPNNSGFSAVEMPTPVEIPRAVLCVKETLRRHPMLGLNVPNNSGFSAVEMPTPVEIPRAVLCVKETLRRHPMLGLNVRNNSGFTPVEMPTPVEIPSSMSATIPLSENLNRE